VQTNLFQVENKRTNTPRLHKHTENTKRRTKSLWRQFVWEFEFFGGLKITNKTLKGVGTKVDC